jgi:hypothetical protein
MGASLYNFPIEQGSSFKLSLTYKDVDGNPINLNGYSAKLIWRTTLDADQTFTTENAPNSSYSFTIDGSTGKIILLLPAQTTNDFNFNSAKYDLELKSPQDLYANGGKQTIRILYGTITIKKRYSNS